MTTLSDDELLSEAREAFARAGDAEAENRREALDDLRFARLGEQWPDAVRRQRERESRPCLTINRLVPHFLRSEAAPAGPDADPIRRLCVGPVAGGEPAGCGGCRRSGSDRLRHRGCDRRGGDGQATGEPARL